MLEEKLIRLYYLDFSSIIGEPILEEVLFQSFPKFRGGVGSKNIPNRHYSQAVGRALLKHLFGDESSKIFYDNYGKPFFPESININFSISYSKNIVVIVTSFNSLVGVDIEYIESRKKENYAHFFSNSEMEKIKYDPTDILFYKMWTTKEAVAKAVGKGFGIDFKKVSCLDEKVEFDDQHWFVMDCAISNYICTVVSSSPINLQVKNMEGILLFENK